MIRYQPRQYRAGGGAALDITSSPGVATDPCSAWARLTRPGRARPGDRAVVRRQLGAQRRQHLRAQGLLGRVHDTQVGRVGQLG